MLQVVMLFGDSCFNIIRESICGGSVYGITIVNGVRKVIESLSLDFHLMQVCNGIVAVHLC